MTTQFLLSFCVICAIIIDESEVLIVGFFEKRKKTIDVKTCIDHIENKVYSNLKPLGFKKHGRSLHRFVSGDISQVITFQCGQSYLDETHLMWVRTGIRVPECMERSFEPQNQRKYYSDAWCNIRSSLGIIKSRNLKKTTTFDLRGDLDLITEKITNEIMNYVIPVFDVLSDRDAILEHRREYPWFDTLNHHLILLEESMIYGRRGDMEKAKALFENYYEQAKSSCRNPGHISYLDQLAVDLGLK